MTHAAMSTFAVLGGDARIFSASRSRAGANEIRASANDVRIRANDALDCGSRVVACAKRKRPAFQVISSRGAMIYLMRRMKWAVVHGRLCVDARRLDRRGGHRGDAEGRVSVDADCRAAHSDWLRARASHVSRQRGDRFVRAGSRVLCFLLIYSGRRMISSAGTMRHLLCKVA